MNLEDLAPPDLVPPKPLTRAQLEEVAALCGRAVTYVWPGDFIEDPDGNPVGMTASTTGTATVGAVTITRAEVDALGITEGDIPNVRIR